MNATGESSWTSTGDSRTPKPVTVNRRPTALSGRWRHAIRPHAMKEMPESLLITAYPGSGGPRSKITGIRAANPAAAAATDSASQNHRPCVGAVNRLSARHAAARDRTRQELAYSGFPWHRADHPARPTLVQRAEPHTVRLAARRATSARSEGRRQARWEGRGVTGSVEHVPHHALSPQRGASNASHNVDRATAPGRTTNRGEIDRPLCSCRSTRSGRSLPSGPPPRCPWASSPGSSPRG